MTLARISIAAFIALTLPFSVFAQEDTLRATIRADILSDPRSSEMSRAEIDALVNALAAQAQEQGVAQEYLEAQNSFEYGVESPVYEVRTSPNPTVIALLALLLVLIGVAVFLIVQRNARRNMPPSAGMVA